MSHSVKPGRAKLRYFDIGANLTHDSLASDLGAVLHRAQARGVQRLVVTGADLPSSRAAVSLSTSRPELLLATAGVHPHCADSLDAACRRQLAELLTSEVVRAVGETGLDYHRNLAPPEQQRKCLEAQLQMAIEVGKPVFLHARDAHADLLAMVRECRNDLPRAVIHCFTGDAAELDDWLELDLHIGITGWICDERRGLHLRDLVGRVPANRLMIETDAPYLRPRDLPAEVLATLPDRHRNEPCTLPHVFQTVAQARNDDPAELAEALWQTSTEFFAPVAASSD